MFDHPTTSVSDDAPRRRLTGDERRAQILAAARTEFARVGYHGTSTAGIARAAHCSEPMLYKHFPSKLALFCETLYDTLTYTERTYEAAVDYQRDVIDAVVEYIHHVMRDPSYQEMIQLRFMARGLLHEETVRDAATRVEAEINHRIVLATEYGLQAGMIRDDISSDYVLSAWNGFMFTAAWRAGLRPGGFEEVIPHLVEFIRQLRRPPAG